MNDSNALIWWIVSLKITIYLHTVNTIHAFVTVIYRQQKEILKIYLLQKSNIFLELQNLKLFTV